MIDLAKLPYPSIVEELDFEEILNNTKTLFKNYLKKDVELIESDEFSALMEVMSYREMLLRARINQAIKSNLLAFAAGTDLDHIVAIYGIERLSGEKPRASVEFELTIVRDNDLIIPAGAVLRSENGDRATLNASVTIKAGTLKNSGIITLTNSAYQSDAKCEYIETPLPFVAKVKQTTRFAGGSDVESDEALRKRAILSLDRFSTAGAKMAYRYHALSSSSKVVDANVVSGGAGVVKIYVQSSDNSDITAEVASYISDDARRPLTDRVVVEMAQHIELVIKADIELFDMLISAEIDDKIKARLSKLKMGEDLNISWIYSKLHQSGVYRATIKEIRSADSTLEIQDIKVEDNSFVTFSHELTYKQAAL